KERGVMDGAPPPAVLLDPLAPVTVTGRASPGKDGCPDLLVVGLAPMTFLSNLLQGRSAVRVRPGRSPFRSGPLRICDDLDLVRSPLGFRDDLVGGPLDLADEDLDLCRRQGPALVRGERGHGRARAPRGDDAHQLLLLDAGPEQRVVEGRCRPDLPVGPVAAG